MALPEHIKKLALDAVEGKETTDWIRRHGGGDASALVARRSQDRSSEDAKRLALETVSQSESTRQIRLVSVNRIDAPLPTPAAGTRHSAGSAMMEYLWRGNATSGARDERERDDGR